VPGVGVGFGRGEGCAVAIRGPVHVSPTIVTFSKLGFGAPMVTVCVPGWPGWNVRLAGTRNNEGGGDEVVVTGGGEIEGEDDDDPVLQPPSTAAKAPAPATASSKLRRMDECTGCSPAGGGEVDGARTPEGISKRPLLLGRGVPRPCQSSLRVNCDAEANQRSGPPTREWRNW
jgi:hypothetical protein